MAQYIDAGKLDKPLWVLELKETADRVWEWVPVRKAWANVALTTKSNLFSKVGVGARDAVILLRRQALTLHNALRWKDQHLFVSAVLEHGRNHLKVSAALVETDQIHLRADSTTDAMTFPGVLTEKYVRHAQEWPMSVNEAALVLVTPKPITLRPGCLVEARGYAWEVIAAHELDRCKNEYEIERRADL